MCQTIAEIYQIDVANFESNFRIIYYKADSFTENCWKQKIQQQFKCNRSNFCSTNTLPTVGIFMIQRPNF